MLGEKPVIAYSIDHAKDSKYITRTIVSTDDQSIVEVARKYGAEVPFMRPAEFAQDATTDFPVFEHALNWLKENHFEPKNLYFVVGDSHWKYHSKDPSGFEEFGTGSLDASNAIRPAISGSIRSTDSKGEIKQLYVDSTHMGGFLEVTASPEKLTFSLHGSYGKQLYSAERDR